MIPIDPAPDPRGVRGQRPGRESVRVPRWAAVWLVAVLAVTGLATATAVAAQYDDGLPAGLEQITVDGQPIDASTIPQVATTNPVFAGRLTSGATEVEIGLGNGEIVRFPLAVDPENGRFRGTAPTPLAATTYALYVNDALVGQFVVTAEATDPATAGGTLDLARLVPYPFDLAETYPGLGALRTPQLPTRFYSLSEEARLGRDAATAAQSEKALLAAGFLQRYNAALAVPAAGDPTRFEIQVVSSVVEYASAEAAQAQFAAGADQDGEPVADAATVGDESRFSRSEDVARQTNAPFRSLTFAFRQDRLVIRVIIADLRDGEPELATAEALAAALQERATAVIAGEAEALAPAALRPDLGRNANPGDVLQAYEVLDGQVVEIYDQDEGARTRRASTFGGTTDVYASSFVGRLGGGAGRRDATPQPDGAADNGGGTIAYGVTFFVFPDEAEALTWLEGLGERLAEDVSYLSLAAVNDATVFADNSATYSFRRQVGEESVGGFGVYVRVGARVFVLEAAGAPEVSLEEVETLVATQVACLEAGVCPSAGAGDAATGAAAPADGTPEAGNADVDREERQRRRQEAAAAGTPGAGGENPAREERERRRQEREQQQQQQQGGGG
jgi:hypothetical protein